MSIACRACLRARITIAAARPIDIASLAAFRIIFGLFDEPAVAQTDTVNDDSHGATLSLE